MEEKKETQTAKAPEKMSYEQLNNVAHQLSEQCQKLYGQLQEANMVNVFKRLDYLFKVVENSHVFRREFVAKAVAEIEELLTIPEEKKEQETEPDKAEEK